MSGRSKDISSACGAVAVTASDSTIIPTTRGLYLGTAGDITVRMANGDVVTFPDAPAGERPWQVDKVYSTSLVAADIVALY